MPLSIRHDTLDLEKIVLLQKNMESYGYRPVDMPIIDEAELFLARAGDLLIEELFTFEHSGKQLALRPEFTASAAYHYARQQSGVVRWQFFGPVFKDQPLSNQPAQQRLSMGAELIGMSGIMADAEMIALAVSGLNQLGIHDWHLTIGHAGLVRELLGKFALDNRTERFFMNHLRSLDSAKHVLDQLLGQADTSAPDDITQHTLDLALGVTQDGMAMGGRDRHDIARRMARKRQMAQDREKLESCLDFLMRWTALSGSVADMFAWMQSNMDTNPTLAEWEKTINALHIYGVPAERITIKPTLARDWDYYTGIVFEITAPEGTQLGGGGRYDELVFLVGQQQKAPAVGFAYYLDNVSSHMLRPQTAILRVAYHPDAIEDAVIWASMLRESGLQVELTEQNTEPCPVLILANGHLGVDDRTYTPDELQQVLSVLNSASEPA